MNQEDFASVLKLVSIITFRYTVIGKLHTNLKEDIYNKAANGISNNELTTVSQIANSLINLYPSDNDFKNDFASKSISTKRGKKIVRYILFSIENHLSQSDYPYEDTPGTIEHILPENGNENYLDEFPQSIHESLVYRLGNYTILEDDKNRACEALPFEEKKEIFRTSQYAITTEITSSNWTPNSIDRRQDKLAKYASSIWRISQFD
ncbi:HNH endonuclease family protein [Reichenbachiella sp. MALMAid0571]|uniref:HNH endonuclease family protein n=1 Tax=Reichenbachiella sp. MALMAid0571 TaxID=3143939 RepID=UPI0032DE440F